MALLDVSDILGDPDFSSFFDVHRCREVVGSNGRVEKEVTLFPQVSGVVTAASPSDLTRGEDYQTMARSISVVTRFPLRGESSGYQPDRILFRGDAYVVVAAESYAHFGTGFYQIECTSIDLVDLPFPAKPVGSFIFNDPTDSGVFLCL